MNDPAIFETSNPLSHGLVTRHSTHSSLIVITCLTHISSYHSSSWRITIMVRLRHRYIVCKLKFEDKTKSSNCLTESSLVRTIRRSIRDLHGIRGVALSKSGLHASYLNRETSVAFVRMRRAAYEIVSSALALVSSIEGEPCGITTLYTGATIKHCNKFLREYQRRALETKFGSLVSDSQRKEFSIQLSSVAELTIPYFRK